MDSNRHIISTINRRLFCISIELRYFLNFSFHSFTFVKYYRKNGLSILLVFPHIKFSLKDFLCKYLSKFQKNWGFFHFFKSNRQRYSSFFVYDKFHQIKHFNIKSYSLNQIFKIYNVPIGLTFISNI